MAVAEVPMVEGIDPISEYIHDAVFDERRRLGRIFAAEPGAFETGHPGPLEPSPLDRDGP